MSGHLYLAYGSNLHPARLTARIPAAELLGTTQLPRHRLSFSKVGSDHSGKATIHAGEDGTVFGAVYRVSDGCRDALDRIEGGYRRIELDEVMVVGSREKVFTYVARRALTRASMIPYDWYRDLVIAGARYHGFPPDYLEALGAVETIPDPDVARHIRQAELLSRLTR